MRCRQALAAWVAKAWAGLLLGTTTPVLVEPFDLQVRELCEQVLCACGGHSRFLPILQCAHILHAPPASTLGLLLLHPLQSSRTNGGDTPAPRCQHQETGVSTSSYIPGCHAHGTSYITAPTQCAITDNARCKWQTRAAHHQQGMDVQQGPPPIHQSSSASLKSPEGPRAPAVP